MKRFNIFHIPALSFYSKELYSDVCHRWKGANLIYLFLLLAVCWIGPMVQMNDGISNFIDNEVQDLVENFPALTIRDGKASIVEEQPYSIKDPESGETLFVIDMTGTITTLEEAEAKVLITETEAIFEKSKNEISTFKFTEVKDLSIDKDKINDWLQGVKTWLTPLIYPFALLFSFGYRAVLVLIYALVGLLIASMCKSERSYGQLYRLSVLAITPSIIFNTILALLNIQNPMSGFIYFCMTLGFLTFGIKASAQEDETETADL